MQALHRYARALAWPWHRLETLRGGHLTAPQHHAEAADAQVRSVIDRVWADDRPLFYGFIAAARALHVPHGDHRALVIDPDTPGREILRWRALTMRLPPGMLVAAGAHLGRAPLRVQLLHRIMAPTVSIAHLHLHVNAALSFELVWSHLCARAPQTKAIKAGPLGMDPVEWAGWLARARLVRLLLHTRLAWPTRPWSEIAAALGDRTRDVTRAIDDLWRGELNHRNAPSAARVNAIANRRRSTRLRTVDDIWNNDPLSDGSPWPEGRLLQRGFRHAEAHPTGRFAHLFAQYLRVRCLLYRHLLDDPDVQGLGLFTQTFDQLKPYRANLDHVFPRIAADEPPLRLGALEVRISPPESATELRALADHLRQTVKAHPDLEVGWIFHVIRHLKRGKPLFHLTRAVRRSVRPLMTALNAEPQLLRLIRGLDIAGDEMAGPLWLALPTLTRVLDQSADLAARYHQPPLQVTVHVGEDFRHLASGLRTIDEPIEWGLLSRGDRLGHALALGLDAADWVDQNPRVEVPLWVRLLDLQWMISRIDRATTRPLKDRIVDRRRLDHCLAEVCEAIGCAPGDAVWKVLGAPRRVARLARREAPRDAAEEVVRRRLFDPRGGLFDRTLEVDTRPERDLLVALRADIATRVHTQQIIVELNPSSNLSVARFDHPLAQPHYHLLPWNQSDAPVPILTLSADDPLQFATSLSDEYAYAWAGLVIGAGRPPGEVDAWLNQVAANSWRARFTVPRAF